MKTSPHNANLQAERLPALGWPVVLGAVVLIVAVSLVAYANSFAVPFVYDDLGNIAYNQALVDFEFRDIHRYLGKRSLPEVTFAANYRVSGLDVFSYHLVNLLIHTLNGLILFWLSLALAGRCYRSKTIGEWAGIRLDTHLVFALFVALLFVSHPIATEAVTYIIQRTVSLTVLLYLLAVATYVQFRVRATRGRWGWAAVSLLATVLAMHSKEISLTLPLAIAWVEICFFAPTGRRLAVLIPWLMLLLYLPWRTFGPSFLLPLADTAPHLSADITGSVDPVSAEAAGTTPLPWMAYLFTQLGFFLTYLRLIFLPIGQSIDHDYTVYRTVFSPPVLLGLVAVGGLVFSLVRAWPRRRMLSFGIGWFLLTMAMESSAIPLLEVAAEYRLYLPLVGVALAASDVALWTGRKYGAWKLLYAALFALIFLLTLTTSFRNTVWQDPEVLWRDALSKAPAKTRPYNNLGTVLLERERYQEAAGNFRRAVELDPAYAHAHNNLGTALAKLGHFEEAAAEYRLAIALDPRMASATINLGTLYLQQGRLEEAARYLEEAARLDIRSVRARTVLGAVYVRQGRLEEAKTQFEAALALDEQAESARNNLELVQELLR